MEEREICYRQGSQLCRSHLVANDGELVRPGILVAPAGGGLGEFAIERARRLAELGYIALAVDIYGDRQTAADLEQARGMIAPFIADQRLLRARMAAALEAILKESKVDSERIGAIGFCFGGMAVLELARSGAPVRATVAFHGLLHTDRPEDAHNILGSVLVCAGASDSLVPVEDLVSFQMEMAATTVDWQLHVYGGAKHGFTNPRVTDENGMFGYDSNADARSWNAMRAFFEESLLPTP